MNEISSSASFFSVCISLCLSIASCCQHHDCRTNVISFQFFGLLFDVMYLLLMNKLVLCFDVSLTIFFELSFSFLRFFFLLSIPFIHSFSFIVFSICKYNVDIIYSLLLCSIAMNRFDLYEPKSHVPLSETLVPHQID